MLVEGGDHLDALRAVVNLMEYAPEEAALVADWGPPVEDKGGDEKSGEHAASDAALARGHAPVAVDLAVHVAEARIVGRHSRSLALEQLAAVIQRERRVAVYRVGDRGA